VVLAVSTAEIAYSVSKQPRFVSTADCSRLRMRQQRKANKWTRPLLQLNSTTGKKALEKDEASDSTTSHRISHAEKSCRDFMDGKAIDTQLSEEKQHEVSRRQEVVRRNRQTVQRIFNVVRFIARLALSFRGHDETQQSLNRGVFLELIHYLAESYSTG